MVDVTFEQIRNLTAPLRARWRRFAAGVLRLFLRYAPSERRRLFAITFVVGVACGLAAVAFHIALRETEAFLIGGLGPGKGHGWMGWMILIPTLGGLVSGVLLHYVLPEARGSGVPEIKAEYAKSAGRVPLHVAIGKFVISLIQIGSGASLGREGPTVQICAGVASFFGRAGALSRQAIRRMLPVGAAAGVAAAFNTPIAAVTFVIEEIVGDLDQAVLSGVVIAAAVAAAIERSVLGAHPILQVSHPYTVEHVSSFFLYAILGVLAAVASIAFTDSLLFLRARFRRITALPPWAHPAVGGMVTGMLGTIALLWVDARGIMGGGYSTLAEALSGNLALQAVFVLCIFKLIATVFSYGSGGSGGIFAPSLFIGGMLGSAVGHADQILLSSTSEQIGAFALVGMGAVFAGIIRAPITSVLIIFEMTNGYSLILPLMVANMTAYALAQHWRPTPIYEALLQQDGIYLSHRGGTTPLSRTPVGAVMTTSAVLIDSRRTVHEVLEQIASHEYAMYPVTDTGEKFLGFVNRYRLRRAANEGEGDKPVSDFIARRDTVYPDTPLIRAVVRLNQLRIHMIAVVERGESQRFLGLLTSSDVVRAEAQASGEPAEQPGRESA